MDTTDLVGYLTGKGIQLRRAGHGEVITNCVFCGENHKVGKLWLNTETWLWQCWVCGERGGRTMLLRHFGDEDTLTYAPGADPNVRLRMLAETADLAHSMLLGNEDKLQYLLDRGLEPETIVAAKLGYVPTNVGISRMLPSEYTKKDLITVGLINIGGVEFFNDSLVIPYFSHGHVVQLREKKQDGKYRTMGGDIARLYNADSLHGADDAVITEGEFDALILAQELAKSRTSASVAVVGLAGTNAWPDQLPAHFENCRRVFTGMDPDTAGRKAAEKLKAEIGAATRIVELPAQLPKCDWTEFLRAKTPEHPHGGHTWRHVEDLLLTADLAGKRVLSARDAQAKWGRVKEETPGVKLGWLALDSVIRPGLTPGQVMIPLAKTGCIQGDAEIVVNRGGAAKKVKLRDLVAKFNGESVRSGRGSYSWDLTIPTYVQREVDGQVRLGRLLNAWASGTKQTYTVTTETGRTIRATDEHPFFTERGWLRLDELKVDDEVHVRGERAQNGRAKSKHYYIRSGLVNHPYRGRRNVKAGGNSVPLHRLVYEAHANGTSLSHYLTVLRLLPEEAALFTFFDPAEWAVHHRDHDEKNNDISNLELLTHEEHARRHADEGATCNVQIPIATERVVSVEPYGLEETFDLEVADDPHNFLANGFVVHNTGKSVWLSNVVYNAGGRRTLFVSMELTSSEVWEHMRRIHFFWKNNLDAASVLPKLGIADSNRLSVGGLATLVEDYTAEYGGPPELLIVDYLQYFSRGFRGASSYEKVSDATMELKAIAKDTGAAIICPSQVNRGAKDGMPLDSDDARDSGVIEETGDYVLSLFRPDSAVDTHCADAVPVVTGAFNMQLLKSRRGGKGRLFNMRFSNLSLVIVDVLDRKACARVEQENMAYRRGIHYDDWLAERTAPEQVALRLA